MASKPVFQRVKKTPTSEEFVRQLDELLRRNKGQFTNVGYDTSSSIPYMVEGRSVRNPLGIDETPVSRSSARLVEPPIYEEPILEEQPTEEPQLDPNSIEGFLELFNQQYTPETAQPVATMPDGSTLYDNDIMVYPDGSIRDYTPDYDPNAQPIASLLNGGTFYEDGSSRRQPTNTEKRTLGISSPIASLEGNRQRWDDQTIRDMAGNIMTTGKNIQGGVAGLSDLIFGRQQEVTQPFGNINPIEPTPGNVNLGTDFRTRNLKNKDIRLPVNARVTQIFEDDGTRFGDISGHQGYGNSVLVELPSGESVRLSHLSKIGNIQVGQTLKPGEYLGTTGATGNVTGEHLDVEYQNEQGKTITPNEFKGFQGQQFATDNSQLPFTSAATAPQPQGQVLGTQTSQPEVLQPSKQEVTAQYQAKPFTNIESKPITSSQQPSQLEQFATEKGLPETGSSERSQAQGTNPYRQAIGDVIDIASTPLRKMGLPEIGLSEAIAGGATINTGKDFIPVKASEKEASFYNPPPTKEDYANRLGENFNKVLSELGQDTQDVLALPGKGIDALKKGLNTSFFRRPEASTVGFERAIGEASPTENVLPVVQGNINAQNKNPETPVAGASASFKPISAPTQSQGVSPSQSRSFSSAASVPSQSRSSSQASPAKGAMPNINYSPAKQVSQPKVAPKPAPASVAKPLNYTPASFTPVYNPPKPAPAPQSQPSNIFSRAASAIKTIFRR